MILIHHMYWNDFASWKMSLRSRIFSLSSFIVEYSNGNTIRVDAVISISGLRTDARKSDANASFTVIRLLGSIAHPSPTPLLKTSIRLSKAMALSDAQPNNAWKSIGSIGSRSNKNCP